MARPGHCGVYLQLALLGAVTLCAAQLPVRTYTIADGLARNAIPCIVQDARGFLWFCTTEGLSRFDGYGFTNYGTEHGLPNSSVASLLISRRGLYWVGTSSGLFTFDPNSPPPQRFQAVRLGASRDAKEVNAILEDRSGSVWVAAEEGLYRLQAGARDWELVDAGIPTRTDGWRGFNALLEDHRGVIWIGGAGGLHRRTPDGRTTAYAHPWRPSSGIIAIYEDREGRIWASDNDAFYRLNREPASQDSIVTRTHTVRDGLPSNRVAAVFESSDGRLWVGASGLVQYLSGVDRFESYTTAEGLVDEDIKSLAEDNHGNLWLGTASAGAMKIARHGFTSYTQADGLSGVRMSSVFVDHAGELCVWNQARNWTLNCFDGKRFKSTHPKYPETIHYFG
jgi:ligand-binding sensor domain-containing protein